MTARIDAVVLAGGRAARLDGAAKPLLEIGGASLLARTVAAARAAGAASVVVVGPEAPTPSPVHWVREDPPFGGPAAGAVAALRTGLLDASAWTLLLAVDLADPTASVRRLVADLPLLPGDTDGLCLADGSGRPQWLTGVYRTAALRAAAGELTDAGRGAPVHALLDDLAIAVTRVGDDLAADVDTWDDLERARRRFADATPVHRPDARDDSRLPHEETR